MRWTIAPERFALAGFSMGGRVCIADHAPGARAGGAAVPVRYRRCAEPEGGAAARQPLVDLAYKEGMEALANAWLPPMLGKSRRNDKAFQKPIVEMICRSTPEDHEKQIKALVSRPDATPLLATIKCPTLVLCGEDDAFTTPSVHAQMTAAIPGAQLTIIPDAGHFRIRWSSLPCSMQRFVHGLQNEREENTVLNGNVAKRSGRHS